MHHGHKAGISNPSPRGNQRIRVLLSAYACEPGKGSEPGVGWRWTRGLAERVQLTVLTRSNNQEAIERAVAATESDDPLRDVRFLYHDLGSPSKFLKRCRLLPTMAYYFLWQWTAARRHQREARAADVVHHLTFCTALCPGFWQTKKHPFVIGPVAAPLVSPYYLSLFGTKAPAQALRNLLIENFLCIPWLRNTFRSASSVIPANSDMYHLLANLGIPAEKIILDTGPPEVTGDHARESRSGAIRLMYAGQLERRKGLELSLRALSTAVKKCECSLDVFGRGPDQERLIRLARSLALENQVRFHGAVPQAELAKHFKRADAFLFTSVRDTSAGVNLEAMAYGLPVICIAHQGVGDITDDSCAERILPGPIPETIQAVADAIVRMANDPALRQQMGGAAAKRARDAFSWNEKFDRMTQIYSKVTR